MLVDSVTFLMAPLWSKWRCHIRLWVELSFQIKNRTKTKERARSLADKRARKVKEIASLSKCDIATGKCLIPSHFCFLSCHNGVVWFVTRCKAYSTWVSLGRPIRRSVPLEELRSKINSERISGSSPSATQLKSLSCSRPLLSQETSLNKQSGSSSLSSVVAPRVLDCTRAVVQSIPGSELRGPRPPVISSRVQDYPRTGTQNITSIAHEGGSNLPNCCRFHGIAADRVRTGCVRSARSTEETKCCAAENLPALKPDNGESLLEWEWDADEGCFQPRQTLNNRSDLVASRYWEVCRSWGPLSAAILDLIFHKRTVSFASTLEDLDSK